MLYFVSKETQEEWAEEDRKKNLPKGFKEGRCKCGNYYGYCGADIKYCVRCIDKMESQSD